VTRWVAARDLDRIATVRGIPFGADVADLNDELLRRIAVELLVAVDSLPPWITQDEQLHAAATRLEAERLLTPQVMADLLVPIFRAHVPSDELERLGVLLDGGQVEQVMTTLRAVIVAYVEEQGY
jgi:hypothetical protein